MLTLDIARLTLGGGSVVAAATVRPELTTQPASGAGSPSPTDSKHAPATGGGAGGTSAGGAASQGGSSGGSTVALLAGELVLLAAAGLHLRFRHSPGNWHPGPFLSLAERPG
jgi:hypothetical protein